MESGCGRRQLTSREIRVGDIVHSRADIEKARRILGYDPVETVEQGLRKALAWYTNAAEG